MYAEAHKRDAPDDFPEQPLKRQKLSLENIPLEINNYVVDHGDDLSTTNDPQSSLDDRTDDTSATSTQPSSPSQVSKCRPREKKFFCDFPDCDKAYSRPCRLSEHLRSHTNERPFACTRDGCEKTFLRDTHLKRHISMQHDEIRDWICDWPGCDKGFTTGQHMRAHRQRHDKKAQFTCSGYDDCEMVFRKQETLDRHVAQVHFNDAYYTCDQLLSDLGRVCNKKFRQQHSLEKHKQREHQEDLRFFCTECNSMDPNDAVVQVGFKTHNDLQKHVKEAHPPKCDMCDFVCATAGQLKAHIDIQHQDLDERRTIPCQESTCDRLFTKKGNMMVHYKSVHEEQKFVCGQYDISDSVIAPDWDGSGACGHGFAAKASLEKHVRTQHLKLPIQLSESREKRKQRKARMSERLQVDPMLIEGGATASLTGHGYDLDRQYPCVVEDCLHRFTRVYDIKVHLTASHHMTSSEAHELAERIQENQAVSGGVFWIANDDDRLQDLELASKLEKALWS